MKKNDKQSNLRVRVKGSNCLHSAHIISNHGSESYESRGGYDKKNNNQRNDSIGGTVGTGKEEYNTNETYSKCINLKIRMKEVHHEYMDLLTSTTSTSTISSTMTEDYVEHLFQLFDHFDENQNDTDENDENDENNEIQGDVLNIMRCLPLHSTMANEIKFLRLSASEHNIGNDPLESERFIRVLLKRTGSTCRLLYSLQLLHAYVTSSLSVSFDTNTTTNRTTTHTTTSSTQNNYQWNNNLINSKILTAN